MSIVSLVGCLQHNITLPRTSQCCMTYEINMQQSQRLRKLRISLLLILPSYNEVQDEV